MQWLKNIPAGLAAALFLAAVLGVSPAQAAAPVLAELHDAARAQAGLLPLPGLAHEIAAAEVSEGQEAVMLQARLSAGSALIGMPISWHLKRVNFSGDLESLASGESAAFAAPVTPGDYVAEITYGGASFVQDFTIAAREQVTLTFILDVGGVRILSRIGEMPLPYGSAMQHEIFAEDGRGMGRLVARTHAPGELLRLPAGNYRIESRLGPGNARASLQVQVKAGQLSTVEIDHRAGLVSFSNINGNEGWRVRDLAGRTIATLSTALSELILEPGVYRVERSDGATTRSTAFTVEPGRSKGVSLPE